MDLAARRIGLFAILKEIHSEMPNEELIYLADQELAPYGTKTLDEVRNRSVAVAAELIGCGAKVVVVACNSASAASADLR